MQQVKLRDGEYEAAKAADGTIGDCVAGWRADAEALRVMRLSDGDELHALDVNDHGELVPACGRRIADPEVVEPIDVEAGVRPEDECAECPQAKR